MSGARAALLGLTVAALAACGDAEPSPREAEPSPRDAMLAQHLRGLEQGQSHDAGVAADDVRHEHRAQPLDGITTRLALGLAAGPIGPHLIMRDRPELDFGGGTDHGRRRGAHHAHARVHLVPALRQQAQHADAIRLGLGFFEDVAVDVHGGVGGQHRQVA